MRNRGAIFFLCLSLSFFPLQYAAAKNKSDADKREQVFRADLDGDGRQELIRVIPPGGSDGETRVLVIGQDKTAVAGFSAAGWPKKFEVVDLKQDGCKQMALCCIGSGKYGSLVIYGFKDGQLYKIFAVASNYGIDVDFSTVLARVMVGKKSRVEDGFTTDIPEWDLWIWSGEKFIRS